MILEKLQNPNKPQTAPTLADDQTFFRYLLQYFDVSSQCSPSNTQPIILRKK